MPFLKSGVTLAVFQSSGYIPVRIDFENIEVREGATILAAIFNNLLGIISRPVAFFSSIFEKITIIIIIITIILFDAKSELHNLKLIDL